jgi:hypothetical protein
MAYKKLVELLDRGFKDDMHQKEEFRKPHTITEMEEKTLLNLRYY